MLRSTSTGARLPPKSATWRFDARPDVTRLDGRQGEVLEAARPRRGSRRDPRLLVRAAASAATEREARRRGRRDREEAPRDADAAARAERRQARDTGTPSGRGRSRGPRAPGARAEVRHPAAAPGARPAGAGTRGAAGEARREPEAAPGEDRGLPLAEGGHQGAVFGRRGPGADRRGGNRDRRADGRHGARDPARQGQDRADAGARERDRRADRGGRARRPHLGPDAARPRAHAALGVVAGRRRAREDEGRARFGRGRREERARAVIVRLLGGDGQYRVDDGCVEALNELDAQGAQAVEAGDEENLHRVLGLMAKTVRERGERLADDDLSASDL